MSVLRALVFVVIARTNAITPRPAIPFCRTRAGYTALSRLNVGQAIGMPSGVLRDRQLTPPLQDSRLFLPKTILRTLPFVRLPRLSYGSSHPEPSRPCYTAKYTVDLTGPCRPRHSG